MKSYNIVTILRICMIIAGFIPAVLATGMGTGSIEFFGAAVCYWRFAYDTACRIKNKVKVQILN